MAMPDRNFSSEKYRYGFNGKEKDKDIAVGDYDFGARIYDGRIGRWLSVDAHKTKYTSYSPYNFAFNSPILFIDTDGNDGRLSGSGTKDDPYVITSNYSYVKAKTEDIYVKALNNAVAAYNSLGKFTVKMEDKEVYVQYNLSVTELVEKEYETMSPEEIYPRIRNGHTFTNNKGKQSTDQNVFSIFTSSNDLSNINIEDFNPEMMAYADYQGIAVDNNSISALRNAASEFLKNANESVFGGTTALSESVLLDILTGIIVHEIFHNLGGDHYTGAKEMTNVTTRTDKVNYGDGNKDRGKLLFDVPTATKKGAVILISQQNRPTNVIPNPDDPQNKKGPSKTPSATTPVKDQIRQPVLRTEMTQSIIEG